MWENRKMEDIIHIYRRHILLSAGVLLISCGQNGPTCGSGTTQREGRCLPNEVCGIGTVNVDGQCVPEGSPGVCGTGTVMKSGQCVPDGSMICEQGTVFNPATSHCDLDPSACAAGTALINGRCVPEDEPNAADFEEAAEPNERRGRFQLRRSAGRWKLGDSRGRERGWNRGKRARAQPGGQHQTRIVLARHHSVKEVRGAFSDRSGICSASSFR
jgi:hypothetical protein